ncbi:acetate--CoA ligase family protein [Achromobacter sp. MY14]|uniref:acetate--CoA ligase family protein n=1 Tax=unclassified Achromobacter TaxID=2626865 RepID=UPI001E5B42CA|nr:acetate--CoA ligase family protein [Achromobacter sp. MY14]MCD0500449.1 acetate--CoA ligase family protein [Achromobacter sp. MY14]
MNGLQKLLRPRSVAVVGASADPAKTSGRPVAYLQKHGFQGRIYPVNPKASEIAGLRCYPDVRALPEAPDVAIVLLSAQHTQQAVRDLADIGTGAAIVLASGYSETGEEGVRRQRELRDAAGSMRILGPNTIGLVNLTDRITLSASGALELDDLHSGAVGLVSQSGGILGALLSRAAARGIGLSKLISTSNEVDLDLADFVDALADDPATRVIALYVESIRNPKTFRAAARKAAAAGKPIVAFKIGRSESGAQAAASHTGALAGADAMYDALFDDVGVIRAQTFADLLDIPAALASERKLGGPRVAVLTSTGGAGTLVADSLGVAGFELPAPDAATGAALRALQTGDHAALDRNPIDVTLAGLQPDLLRNAIRIVLESDQYDALVVVVGSSGVAQPELMANALRDSLALSSKPLMAFVSPHAPRAAEVLSQYGIPAFPAPESIGAALSAMWRVQRNKERAAPVQPRSKATEPIFCAERGSLDEAQAKALFARFGIPGVREITVTSDVQASSAAATLGPRVVLKLLSSKITHKSDVGGVAVNVAPEDIAERLRQMTQDVQRHTGQPPQAFLVQEMVTGAAEVIVGLHRDTVGTALLLGMGGVVAELVRDTTLLLLPEDGAALTEDAVLAALQRLKTWPLLDGYRGRPKADVPALIQAVLAFARMATALQAQLIEAEINPLFVKPLGQGVCAADGVVVLKD